MISMEGRRWDGREGGRWVRAAYKHCTIHRRVPAGLVSEDNNPVPRAMLGCEHLYISTHRGAFINFVAYLEPKCSVVGHFLFLHLPGSFGVII